MNGFPRVNSISGKLNICVMIVPKHNFMAFESEKIETYHYVFLALYAPKFSTEL